MKLAACISIALAISGLPSALAAPEQCRFVDTGDVAILGDHLAGDKGINLPDSFLQLPALTEKDLSDLSTVVELADLVEPPLGLFGAHVRRRPERRAG